VKGASTMQTKSLLPSPGSLLSQLTMPEAFYHHSTHGEYRKCTVCAQLKPLHEFFRRSPRKNAKPGQTYYMAQCKSCCAEKQRQYRAANAANAANSH
jgi:hypothetical protein